VLVVAVVNFWLLIPATVMFAFIYVLRVYYVSTSRSIKRLEGISKFTCFLSLRMTPLCFCTLYGWACVHTWQTVTCL
jgi:ATP-binding cassette subfamily C (CFTR/MRP) protein 4